MPERLVVIGGVAAGATAAARARRLSESIEIVLIEKGPYVSFANCGLPYFISRDIEKRSALLLQTPEGFLARYGVQVLLETEAVEIDRIEKRIRIQVGQGSSWLSYDKLILAQGGTPIIPPIPGADSSNAFKLWSVPDMDRIHQFIEEQNPTAAAVVGGGFIGLEMAEALSSRGLKTTVIEGLPRVLNTMDAEFGAMAERVLQNHGVDVETGVTVAAIEAESRQVLLSDGRRIAADLVLLSVGVRPELALAKRAGLALGSTGALAVDRFLTTSDPDIFAAGDMVEVTQKISGKTVRVPLAGPANRQGRLAAGNTIGKKTSYNGTLGTSVVKIFDHTAASTGLTEKAARESNLKFGVAVVHKDHHAGYFPGAKELTLKVVYETPSGRLLGAQAFGMEGVEKRIDVLATALQGRLTVDDLCELDLSYAPPYSSANDPINLAAFVAQNDLSGDSPLITATSLSEVFQAEKDVLLDVRNLGEFTRGHVPGALHIPVDELRSRLDEVPKDAKIYVHCRVGFRGHLAVRILLQNGWKNVWNVTGGYLNIQASKAFEEEKS